MKKFITFVWTKGSFFLKAQFVICCFILISVTFLVFVATTPHMTDKKCKRYIIEHKDNITKDGVNQYRIQTPDLNYYEVVTIRKYDTGYHIIFWAERYHWKWMFKLDKSLDTDILYKEYKGKNTKLDKKLMEVLN